jgi:hypothetical protein
MLERSNDNYQHRNVGKPMSEELINSLHKRESLLNPSSEPKTSANGKLDSDEGIRGAASNTKLSCALIGLGALTIFASEEQKISTPSGDTPKLDKDHLKRLTDEKDVGGLKKFAETVEDKQLADTAVNALVEIKPSNLQAILEDLARGNSYAVAPALANLESETWAKLSRERVGNGDLIKLWLQNKIETLDLLSYISNEHNDEKKIARVDQLFKSLADKPDWRVELAKALVDYQTGFRDWSVAFDLPDQIRMQALDIILRDRPPDLEKILLKLGGCRYKEFAKRAQDELVRMWTADTPAIPGQPSQCELLRGRHLIDFVRDASQLSWSEPPDLEARYQRYMKGRQTRDAARAKLYDALGPEVDQIGSDIDEPAKMAARLKDRPEILEL